MVRIQSTIMTKTKNALKHQKYYFLIFRFCLLICKTYFIVKIRGKIDLKLNWSVKTPLRVQKGVALWAPGIVRYLSFLVFRPSLYILVIAIAKCQRAKMLPIRARC